MKLIIWMNMPSHHQSGFFEALRSREVDLRVNYYGSVTRRRRLQGWAEVGTLPAGERLVRPEVSALHAIQDWRDRVHVVPGYASAFLRKLVAELSRSGAPWMHWSERSHPGARWMLSYPLKAWYARKVNTTAMAALAVGDLARLDFIRWGIRPEKIRILPYSGRLPPRSIEPDSDIARLGGEATTVFLYVGALNRRKGIDILLDAFAQVARVHQGARLALVGRDETGGRYQRLLRVPELRGRVLLKGPMPFERLGSALQAADVLVLPSRHDGWGMVLAEAAGYGKALIGSDACGATAHLIRDEWNGFSVPAGDATALVHAMKRYVAEPELARIHGARSAARYLEFTPESNAKRLLSIVTQGGDGNVGATRSNAG